MGPTFPVIDRALARLGSAVAQRPAAFVIALLVSLAPTGWLAASVDVRASFLELLPDDEPPVQQLQTVLAHARATSDISIAVSRRDPALAEAYARALVDALSRDPGVTGIGGHIDMDWVRERRLLYVPEQELEELVARTEATIDRELMRSTGLYVDLESDDTAGSDTPQSLVREIERSEDRLGRTEWIITSDGRYLCVWAFFAGSTGDLAFGRAAFDRVRAIDARLRDGTQFPRDLEVRFAGGIPTRVDDERALAADLRVAGAVGFLAVVLLIVLSLRAPRALVVLAVPLLTGLVWTFAFARVAVGHLNIISGFLFSILSGLGIEYGIHLMHRYRELRDQGLDPAPAIEALVAKAGRALFAGSITNASVFGVIAFAQFRGFAEFGLIAAVGLLLTLVATLTGMPALLLLTERWRPLPLARSAGGAARAVRGVVVPRALRWSVLVSVPLIAAVSLIAVVRGTVRFDGNWRLLSGDSETTQFQEYLRHHFSGLYSGGLLYVPPDEDLDEVIRVVGGVRASRAARHLSSEVVDLDTLNEVFPPHERQMRRAELARQLGAQLDRVRPEMLDERGRAQLEEGRRLVRAAQPVRIEELSYALVGSFVTTDGRGSIAHLRMHETDDANTDVLVRWAAEAREIVKALRDHGIDAPLLSENWIAGEIFERVARDGRMILFGTLLAVFIVLLLDFRSPLAAGGALLSVVLGILCVAGGMWLTGVRLNFMNAAIVPVCVGISLDNAIHVYHRWREGGPGSIPQVLRHTTAANALASATNLIGFAALALTHHAGLRSVAYLAMIGVVTTYVSTTLWFPMLFATIDEVRARRTAAYRPDGVENRTIDE